MDPSLSTNKPEDPIMDLQELATLATIIGAPAAICALVYTGVQLKRTLTVERGRFMLELERMISLHDDVHMKLRPGGEWADGGGPKNSAEWARVEDYMGFFEHCELLLEAGTLDVRSFQALFSYRIGNILANPVIVEAKLVREGAGWTKFLDLVRRLGLRLPPAR